MTQMLTGSLVRLRAIELSDLPLLAQWRSNPVFYDAFYEFQPISIAAQEEWYRRHCFNNYEFNFIIEEQTSGENRAIGIIALINISWRNRTAEIGRLLIGDTRFHQLGYAPESIILIIEYAFEHLQLNKLYCEVLESQIHVISLHRKLGVVDEGTRHQHIYKSGEYKNVVMLALFRDEYIRRNRLADLRTTLAKRSLRARRKL